jgi:Protein of unknown function (DUF2846)
MRFRVVTTSFCLALLFCVAHAQETQTAITQTAAPQADNAQVSSSNNSQATVYIYRYKQFTGSALSPSVYCDESELARMENGRFFEVKLTPGKHAFRSNDKQAGIDLDLKGGQEYYIRVELVAGMMKGHGRLVFVQPEQGVYEIKKLKPLDANKVKNTEHVTPVSFESH